MEALTLSTFESRYQDRQYIGSGGFAKVYKAFDHAQNKYVALKVADVRPEWQKFTLLREVELVNKLQPHPNIARYDACYRFDMGVAGVIDFAVLKFYEDGNLEQFLKEKPLTAADHKIIIRGILQGVSFLHQNNYVHRDLKAQNILLQREDGVWVPKITDFGLSRSLGTDTSSANSSIGLSFAYASPEQIKNERITTNVDLWAAGILIYRIITGALPFKVEGGTESSSQVQLELSRQILSGYLPEHLATVPEPYQGMIRVCLVLDPKERVQSANYLLDMLEGIDPLLGNADPADLQPIGEKETKSLHDSDADKVPPSGQIVPENQEDVIPDYEKQETLLISDSLKGRDELQEDASKTIILNNLSEGKESGPSSRMNTHFPEVHNDSAYSFEPFVPSIEPEYHPQPAMDMDVRERAATPSHDPGDSDRPLISSGGSHKPEDASSTGESSFLATYWKHVSGILVLAIVGFVVITIWRQPKEQTPKEGITDQSEAESYTQIRGFDTLLKEQQQAMKEGQIDVLTALRQEWKPQSLIYDDDYRWPYQFAQNLAFDEQWTESTSQMDEAVRRAIGKGQESRLIREMEADAKATLRKFVRHDVNRWKRYKKALLESNETYLE
ncbi:MAG: serine/threonine protein kinase [Saprospiraceae bacterium]|nr:serine/threonine protein kinase [Saprospiraceae bacterium]